MRPTIGSPYRHRNNVGSCRGYLDRTHLIADMFERYVAEHEALDGSPQFKAKVETISVHLQELYQTLGKEFL